MANKIDFGPEIAVRRTYFLKGISRQLGDRTLTCQECFDLYSFINKKFKESEEKWNEWKQRTDDIAFHMDISIANLYLMKSVKDVKDVHISVRKNEEKGHKKYITTILHGLNNIRYRKFAYDNLCCALDRIGVWKDSISPKDISKKLRKKFCDLTDFEKENGWYLPTEAKLRPSVFDECSDVFDKYRQKSAISLFLKPIDLEEWDILVVIADDYDNPIKIEECVPRIYRTIDRKKLKDAFEVLIRKADEEGWTKSSIRYYIESVYDRLEKEYSENSEGCVPKKNIFAVPKNEHDAMVFCTGLVTPDKDGAHYIYAYCSNPDRDGVYQKIEWLSHGGTQRKRVCNSKLDFDDESVNHGLPYPPNWVSDPNRLLFDYRYGSITEKQIIFYFKHIYDNLYERVHESIRDQFQERFPSDKYKEKEEEFKTYIEDAWRTTRKILQKSFKVAIPTYYRGEIQLLVPLFLDEKNINQASVALVLTLDNKGRSHYFCPTCLSLEMARMDSRVITRIDDTWLKPIVESGNSGGENQNELDWEKEFENALEWINGERW